MRRIFVALLFVAIPLNVFADGDAITRAEGYKLIWETINRPAEDTNETPFVDVLGSHQLHKLITYGKARGVLNDDRNFYPDEDLYLNDALLWLLRSRNTDYPTYINLESINSYTNRYGLLDHPQDTVTNPSLTHADLALLTQKLDGTLKNEKHIVSYYSEDFAGRNTAFGETFDPNAMTAAHLTFPHNTLVRVHTPFNKSVTVRINDRGPYINGRDMDLSRAAFQRISDLSHGILKDVTFERLGNAETVTTCPNIRYQRRLGRVLLSPGIPRVAPKGTTIMLSANRSFRMIQMRAPLSRPVRSSKWTGRGQGLEIKFEKEGIYTFIIHEDSGKRRRFRTRVTKECK
jgi:rare lipoprotein A (peptidoglycan hydrolase)